VSGFSGEGENANWYWLPRSGTGSSYVPSPLLNLFSAVKNSILPIDGLDLGDPDERLNGDKTAQGMMFMGTGWIPVPLDDARPEVDPANAKQITVPKGTKTIDQYLLDKVAALTQGAPGPIFRSIQLGGTRYSMKDSSGFACLKVLSYAGNGQPLFAEGRSQDAFNNIFGRGLGIDPVVLARRQAQKNSIVNLVIK